jgi:Do/DeqQ family serine protease
MKKIISIVLFSALGGALTLGGYKLFVEKPQIVIERTVEPQSEPTKTNFIKTISPSVENTDFTVAAEKTIHSVVHVKNTSFRTVRDPFREFFYGQEGSNKKYSQVGTGSGVIISSDGYIVTNNHVIQGATEIEVTLNNKKSYKAELIGTDPSNDIALIKVDAHELPYVTLGDSDAVKIGEWVLAVGNPYNLTSTVTAGIVSAKGRDLEGNSGVESFIQTDAAVNSGNSGGALVNIRGELIGINTAITSRTGSFIGYSFAVPSNITKKVIEDLMEFGNVQAAILGIYYDAEFKEEGVKIDRVNSDGGAEKAGLEEGDIIIRVNSVKISKFSDLKGQLNAKRPGDIINVAYLRDNVERTTNVTLSKNEISRVSGLGLELKNLDASELKKLDISNGVKIIGISNKELIYYGVKEGYVITSINNNDVSSAADVNNMINNKEDGDVLRIEMLNLEGELERYIFR